MPPFTSATAKRHSAKARTSPKAARASAKAATGVYRKTKNEGRAIRAGNAAAAKTVARKGRRSKRK